MCDNTAPIKGSHMGQKCDRFGLFNDVVYRYTFFILPQLFGRLNFKINKNVAVLKKV